MTTLDSAPEPEHRGGARAAPSPVEPQVVPFRFGRRDQLLNLGFWTLFGAVTAAVLLSDDYSPVPGHPLLEGGVWLLQAYIWAALTPLVFWLVWRFHPGRGSLLLRGLALLVAALALAAVVDLARELLLDDVLGLSHGGRRRGGASFHRFWVHTINEPVICASIFAAAFVREHLRRVRAREEHSLRLQAHAAAVEARAAQLQAQLVEARLVVLRSQLNPHFLFNTLNAVSGLLEDDPPGALRMIARLSDLLRSALQERDAEEIPLGDELKLTQHYLEILEIRYQGRLRTSVRMEPGVQDALVPSLILQPLVENAMKHGVGRAGGYGRIEVHARRVGGQLVLGVLDTGGGVDARGAAELTAPARGTGVGLHNTRERLREMYGADQSLTLLPRPEGGMIAEITLPYRESEAPVSAAEAPR
jgi:two-component sensor histidine kinase